MSNKDEKDCPGEEISEETCLKRDENKAWAKERN